MAGSSSVKFQVFAVDGDGRLQRAAQGTDGWNWEPSAAPRDRRQGRHAWPTGPIRSKPVADVSAAFDGCGCMAAGRAPHHARWRSGIGWSHGGPDFDRPALIDHGAGFRALERYATLAPLHQPHNLAPDQISPRQLFRALPQGRVLRHCLSSRPRQGRGSNTRSPYQLYEEGVRRYGLPRPLVRIHFEDVCRRSRPRSQQARVIVAHLGSGASMCALKGGSQCRKHDGLLPHSTVSPWERDRARSIPAWCSICCRKREWHPGRVQDFLYRDCGLKGLSGVSKRPCASYWKATIRGASFCHRLLRLQGWACLPECSLLRCREIDAFVFTAGVGENSSAIRARIAEKLAMAGCLSRSC